MDDKRAYDLGAPTLDDNHVMAADKRGLPAAVGVSIAVLRSYLGASAGWLLTGYRESCSTPTIVAGVATVDYAAGNTAVITLSQNVDTVTILNVPPAGMRGTISLWVVQGSVGGLSFVFPAAFDFGVQSVPAVASGPGQETIVSATTRDGGVTWKAELVWSSV